MFYQKSVCKSYCMHPQRMRQHFKHIFPLWPVMHLGYWARDALEVTLQKSSMPTYLMQWQSVMKWITSHWWRVILIGGWWTTDTITKKELEEYGYLPILGKTVSGDNGTSGDGEKDDCNKSNRKKLKNEWIQNPERQVKNKKNTLFGHSWRKEGKRYHKIRITQKEMRGSNYINALTKMHELITTMKLNHMYCIVGWPWQGQKYSHFSPMNTFDLNKVFEVYIGCHFDEICGGIILFFIASVNIFVLNSMWIIW